MMNFQDFFRPGRQGPWLQTIDVEVSGRNAAPLALAVEFSDRGSEANTLFAVIGHPLPVVGSGSFTSSGRSRQ